MVLMVTTVPRFEMPDEEGGHDKSRGLLRGGEDVGVLARGEEPAGVQVQQQVQRGQTPAVIKNGCSVDMIHWKGLRGI